VLDDAAGKQAVAAMQAEWAALKPLQGRYAKYQAKADASAPTETSNRAQHQLREHCDPFFAALHADLKQLDKQVRQHEKRLTDVAQAEGKRGGVDRDTKALKTALDALHAEVRAAEVWFGHVRWLQERFPEAAYEDVTGLCKLASPAEVAEQDYSLNPGRYVGVVVEEDGKTEEEFVAELLAMEDELIHLGRASRALEATITENIKLVVRD
jgi:type I restriction enzyme M protein